MYIFELAKMENEFLFSGKFNLASFRNETSLMKKVVYYENEHKVF